MDNIDKNQRMAQNSRKEDRGLGSDDDTDFRTRNSSLDRHERSKSGRFRNLPGSVTANLRASLDPTATNDAQQDLMYFLNKILSQNPFFASANQDTGDTDPFLMLAVRELSEKIFAKIISDIKFVSPQEEKIYGFCVTLAILEISARDKGHCGENANKMLVWIGEFLQSHPRDKFPEIQRIFSAWQPLRVTDNRKDHISLMWVPKGASVFSGNDPNEVPHFPEETIIFDPWIESGPPSVPKPRRNLKMYGYIDCPNLYRKYQKNCDNDKKVRLNRKIVEDSIQAVDPVFFANCYKEIMARMKTTIYNAAYLNKRIDKHIKQEKRNNSSGATIFANSASQPYIPSSDAHSKAIENIVRRNRVIQRPIPEPTISRFISRKSHSVPPVRPAPFGMANSFLNRSDANALRRSNSTSVRI